MNVEREELYKKFKKDNPETIGEKDKHFDTDNFCDWLSNQVTELKKENERLQKRDCNASVQLCYETKDYPFNTEELKIVDVGVSDNIYMVESELFNKLSQELKDKEEIIEKFQELTKERDVYFHQDDEDGYFIKVSDKGSYNKQFEVAELEDMKCNNILTAIKNAIEYMKRKDSDFENLLNRFNK